MHVLAAVGRCLDWVPVALSWSGDETKPIASWWLLFKPLCEIVVPRTVEFVGFESIVRRII